MLHRAFVSCSLHPGDKDVVDFFRESLRQRGINPRTIGIDVIASTDREAARLAKQEIQQTDCIVVILTPRYMINGYKSSEWTYEEPAMGYMGDKSLYVFYESGIELKGITASTAEWTVEFDRRSLNMQEEYARLNSWVNGIREDLDTRKARRLFPLGGAVLGALSGAIIGGFLGRRGGAIIGALIGGGLGGGAGILASNAPQQL